MFIDSAIPRDAACERRFSPRTDIPASLRKGVIWSKAAALRFQARKYRAIAWKRRFAIPHGGARLSAGFGGIWVANGDHFGRLAGYFRFALQLPTCSRSLDLPVSPICSTDRSNDGKGQNRRSFAHP